MKNQRIFKIIDFIECNFKKPLVSVIFLNYNSSGIINIVKKSLKCLLKVTYRPLEVIIVDNGSTDDSFDEIYKITRYLISEMDFFKLKNLRVLVVRLSKNFGFVGANNIAFKIIDSRASYVALINNDFVITNLQVIDKLVQILEKLPSSVCGLQGIILGRSSINKRCKFFLDNKGFKLTEYLRIKAIRDLNRISIPTYLDGAFSIYRVKCLNSFNWLFIPYFFMYCDDIELGLRLQSHGYILASVPIIAGIHYASSTIKELRLSVDRVKFEIECSAFMSCAYTKNPIVILLKVLNAILMTMKFRDLKILRSFLYGIEKYVLMKQKCILDKYIGKEAITFEKQNIIELITENIKYLASELRRN